MNLQTRITEFLAKVWASDNTQSSLDKLRTAIVLLEEVQADHIPDVKKMVDRDTRISAKGTHITAKGNRDGYPYHSQVPATQWHYPDSKI